METTKNNNSSNAEPASDLYPGVAIDKADDEKVTTAAVKNRTKTENNNPRNNDMF